MSDPRPASGATPSQDLRALVQSHRIVVCTGSGGVGKTTTAAVMALEGAKLGLKACVVTIDPAKRLADALGLESDRVSVKAKSPEGLGLVGRQEGMAAMAVVSVEVSA